MASTPNNNAITLTAATTLSAYTCPLSAVAVINNILVFNNDATDVTVTVSLVKAGTPYNIFYKTLSQNEWYDYYGVKCLKGNEYVRVTTSGAGPTYDLDVWTSVAEIG